MNAHQAASLVLVAIVLLVAVSPTLATPVPLAEPIPPPDAVVTELLNKLNDDSFTVRESATKELEDLVMANRLSPTQLGMIRTFASQGALEGRKRAEQILQKWVTSAPGITVNQVLGSIVVQELFDRNGGFLFRFGDFFGEATQNDPDYAGLYRAYEAARNALTAGDTTRIVPALNALKTYVDNRFDALGLSHDADQLQAATKQEVLDKLTQAINQANVAIGQIGQGSNNVNPPPRERLPIEGQGNAGTGPGDTLRLFFALAPVVPGDLDVFMPLYDLALFDPPPGYEFVANIFDLLADEVLEVTGPISVGIEYGDIQLLGNPVRVASRLRIVRLANGGDDFLDFDNDLVNRVITGFYQPESRSLGLDQFGEFAIVQPAPAPATLLLAIAGALALVHRRGGRRHRR